MDGEPSTIDRADLVGRLVALRAVLARMARDLALARCQVNALTAENRRLILLVGALEHEGEGAFVDGRGTDPDARSLAVPS